MPHKIVEDLFLPDTSFLDKDGEEFRQHMVAAVLVDESGWKIAAPLESVRFAWSVHTELTQYYPELAKIAVVCSHCTAPHAAWSGCGL